MMIVRSAIMPSQPSSDFYHAVILPAAHARRPSRLVFAVAPDIRPLRTCRSCPYTVPFASLLAASLALPCVPRGRAPPYTSPATRGIGCSVDQLLAFFKLVPIPPRSPRRLAQSRVFEHLEAYSLRPRLPRASRFLGPRNLGTA